MGYNNCKQFDELIESKIVDIRVGCIALKTSDGSGCVENTGLVMRYCPFCGEEIKSEFKNGHWSWWHN